MPRLPCRFDTRVSAARSGSKFPFPQEYFWWRR
jgi:hypothetical protein